MERTIPRFVFTNDRACDDMNSLVDLLLCVNFIEDNGRDEYLVSYARVIIEVV